MPADLIGSQPGLVTLRVSGLLTQAELAAVQARAAALMNAGGALQILVLLEAFAGWEAGGQWDDFSFQDAFDRQIARMASVGEERWRDLALLFTAQGLRTFPIEFFPAGQLERARQWLAAG